ncbi:MAG: hypothetical protein APR63_07845 [Desulfuromonas sp. SDB]|nr:MAG: hypothetical protein APR63_07845 [Desulfuromonas sp. SDB]
MNFKKNQQQKISAVIITRNEQQNIERCLNSLDWVDEIVVLDSGSTDKTKTICRQKGCRVISAQWVSFGSNKQKAVENASYDWILSVDADEQVSPELKNRIRELLVKPTYSAYRIKRESFYLDRFIRYCWKNDYPVKFFNRQKAAFNSQQVHETVDLCGELGVIEQPLYHYSYLSISSHLLKMDRYSQITSEVMKNEGKRVNLFSVFLRFHLMFLKMYLLKRGFMDGKWGLILSFNSAYGVFLKYLKLWVSQNQN